MITLEPLKEIIVKIVEGTQGCKATELVPLVFLHAQVMLGDAPGTILIRAINELVDEGKLVGVAYTLASLPEKTKMFLLPADTVVHR